MTEWLKLNQYSQMAIIGGREFVIKTIGYKESLRYSLFIENKYQWSNDNKDDIKKWVDMHHVDSGIRLKAGDK